MFIRGTWPDNSDILKLISNVYPTSEFAVVCVQSVSTNINMADEENLAMLTPTALEKKRKLDQRSPQEGGHGSILGPWVEKTVQKASQEYLESFKTALFEKMASFDKKTGYSVVSDRYNRAWKCTIKGGERTFERENAQSG